MHNSNRRYSLAFASVIFFVVPGRAIAGLPQDPMQPSVAIDKETLALASANAEIYVKGPKGEPVAQPAVVTISRPGGQFFAQGTTKAGLAKFDRVPYSEFNVQVVAPGYRTATTQFEISGPGGVSVTVDLQPLEAEEAAASKGFYALPPKVQKDVGKALEALRATKPNDAWHPLQAAQKNAPNNPEIDYLLGLYSSQLKNDAQARSYWTKTLELDPKHLNALLALGNDLLQDKKSAEALPYLDRAVQVEPSSWRAHALFAQALVIQKRRDEAVKEAERAIELGHERASTTKLTLARALAERGDRDQAIQTLQEYVTTHPADAEASKALVILKDPKIVINPDTTDSAVAGLNGTGADAAALPAASNWLPPNIDDSVPSVEPGAACALDDVVRKAGDQINELIRDVDRFTATESLVHQTIDRWGAPSSPEKRNFDYVVSIQLLQGKYLNVEEYRSAGGAPAEFPGGVVTNGLPSLVLIFHPVNVPNFEMTCEGLSRTSSGLAWQVHFKQRTDKPNTIKRYRIGADGPSYPVALKGRAWISADTFEIVRLETDLVSPIPQIKLVADHSDIEYGPVKFKDGKISMWLPQSADVYYDWRGRRIHRRHSFSQYLLFGVDEKQKISTPKVDDPVADSGPNNTPEKPKN